MQCYINARFNYEGNCGLQAITKITNFTQIEEKASTFQTPASVKTKINAC